MKKLVTNYSFDKVNKQITFADYNKIELENVLIITNVTSNVIIYNFADNLLGGTVSGNVLTLTYNTASMNDIDDLQIFIDDGQQPTTPADIQQMELINSLRIMAIAMNSPVYLDKTANQIRAQITGALTSLTTVTNLTNIGSFPGDHLQRMNNMTAWATNVRGRIS